MKIDKISKYKGRYRIKLDDGSIIYTYDEVILKNGLLYHKYINKKLLDKIYNETAYYKGYNKALDMISRRIRSEYEIRSFFERSEINNDDIDSMIGNLKRIGLINDLNYAKAYTNDRINLSMDGPYKIKRHLEEVKIDESTVYEVITNIDESILISRIDKIIMKKISTNTKYTPYILKQKIINYLVNLGYDKNDVIKRLDLFEINNIDSAKQMDKIFNRLQKKYNGKELLYKLRGNLYSKGYSLEEIDNYIEKIAH